MEWVHDAPAGEPSKIAIGGGEGKKARIVAKPKPTCSLPERMPSNHARAASGREEEGSYV